MVHSEYRMNGGKCNARILCEVPHEKRDKGSQKRNDEERKAGYPGNMSRMWHQDVQNRESLSRHDGLFSERPGK